MEKVTAVFYFKEEYMHTNYSRQEVTINLDVDYQQKTFSIKPAFSIGDGKFGFIAASKDYKKWLAVLKAIEKAIEFANYEIGVTERVTCKDSA